MTLPSLSSEGVGAIAFGLLIFVSVVAWRVVVMVRDALKTSRHVFRAPCLSPKETHDRLLYIMRVFKELADQEGLRYWIDYGTLLGAWRLGTFLPWDHDVDLCYRAEDAWRLRALRFKLQARGITLRIARSGLYYEDTKLDIDAWTDHGGRLCRVDPGSRRGLVRWHEDRYDDFPSAWIEPLWQIEFAGEMWPCPNHPNQLLRHRYPTHRFHPRLTFPHKQRCWFCLEFWRWAWRIFTSRYDPVVVPAPPAQR